MTINKDIFMLCNSITESEAVKLDENKWIVGEKKDGERLLALILDGDIILFNRRGKTCNHHFPEIVEDLKKITKNGILDCELVSQDEDFGHLQSRAHTQNTAKIKDLIKTIPLRLWIFDIIKDGDEDIRNKPLTERLERLNAFIQDNTKGKLEFCEILEQNNDIKGMLDRVKSKKGEGIVLKLAISPYISKRANEWLKCKMWNELDVKVNRYEVNNAGIKVFGTDGIVECQVSGEQHNEVREAIDKDGEVEITIQYLSINEETKKPRFPSYKKLVVK